MTDLTKDEIIALAREHYSRIEFENGTVHECYEFSADELNRFATLCRAPLVAEVDRLEAEAEAGVFVHGRDMDWLRAERDAAIERADELGADKGTYFRLYEQACIQMTEKDKYGEHYRTLFNNADEANNRLIDERDALRAELGQYPEIQAMLMSENKQLRAEVEQCKKDAARYRWLVSQPNGGFFHPVFAVNNFLSWKSKAQYDAAIDASIAKEQS